MIKRSVLFAIALLLLYAAYVSYGNAVPVSQHQWQDNTIRTQNYSYTDSLHKKDVIIGTSLTAMMEPNTLPGDVYMLVYPGMSVVNGIITLKENNIAPKYIFIEENAVLKPVNTDFNDYIFGDIHFYSKKYFPFLRDCYQPVGQAAGFVERHSAARVQFFSDWIFNPVLRVFQSNPKATIDKEAHYRELKRRRNMVDTAALISSFTQLKNELKWLEDRGTRIYFYATPTHPDVFKCKQSKAVMDAFKKYFPPGKYNYFEIPDVSQYTQLHDQLHLDKPSAIRYARVFSKELNSARGH
ncbi:hypothetical protein EOD41_16315 [Mucilaginibacter limnophilus]|uniref:Uncharacterized protein n=1 Tax=Mucilaginibacter limnophilus TaxID=1932778 RepID=A0A3S3TF41_9SPHI|nr:hypothetical protein [Mucilaginibacter limnophilus]RVT98357.1 hypothetical protein EOD41_16315 [Mucilaginibacter limnophilus]